MTDRHRTETYTRHSGKRLLCDSQTQDGHVQDTLGHGYFATDTGQGHVQEGHSGTQLLCDRQTQDRDIYRTLWDMATLRQTGTGQRHIQDTLGHGYFATDRHRTETYTGHSGTQLLCDRQTDTGQRHIQDTLGHSYFATDRHRTETYTGHSGTQLLCDRQTQDRDIYRTLWDTATLRQTGTGYRHIQETLGHVYFMTDRDMYRKDTLGHSYFATDRHRTETYTGHSGTWLLCDRQAQDRDIYRTLWDMATLRQTDTGQRHIQDTLGHSYFATDRHRTETYTGHSGTQLLCDRQTQDRDMYKTLWDMATL